MRFSYSSNLVCSYNEADSGFTYISLIPKGFTDKSFVIVQFGVEEYIFTSLCEAMSPAPYILVVISVVLPALAQYRICLWYAITISIFVHIYTVTFLILGEWQCLTVAN